MFFLHNIRARFHVFCVQIYHYLTKMSSVIYVKISQMVIKHSNTDATNITVQRQNKFTSYENASITKKLTTRQKSRY
jgi:hypothetical protein